MVLFAVSDIIISITLIINAVVLSSKKYSSSLNTDQTEASTLNVITKIKLLHEKARKLSGVLLIWNIVFFMLMIFVFNSKT